MIPALEIIIPARNPPPEALLATIHSLIDQTMQSFAIVISDNGDDESIIRSAANILRNVGIKTTVIRQSISLGRVQHWNAALNASAHRQWLKPLFVGDTLEREYVQQLRPVIDAGAVDATFCHYWHRDVEGRVFLRNPALPPKSLARLLPFIVRLAPPCCSAFTHKAFISAGQYSESLPMFADSMLCTALHRKCRVAAIPLPLANFNEHPQRYSARTRGNGRLEYVRFLCQAAML